MKFLRFSITELENIQLAKFLPVLAETQKNNISTVTGQVFKELRLRRRCDDDDKRKVGA